MRLLTLLLVLFTSQLSAQFNTIDGKTFRRLSEFSMPTKNFGADTVKSISITDTSRASGLLLLSKDTTAMYVEDDTMNMFTTSKAWKFTPKILSDTVNINYILTNCPKPNRNELLIVTPNAQATTTACDTIPYIYFDTIRYGVDMSGLYIPLAGTDTGSPVTGNIEMGNSQMLFNDLDGNLYFKIGYNPNDDLTGIFYEINDTIYSRVTTNMVQIEMDYRDPTTDKSTQIVINEEGLGLAVANDSSLGIYSNFYFVNKYTDNSFIQKKYVDDNFTPNSSILTDTATLNFGSISAQLFEDLTVTVTGASVGDVVSIGIPTAAAVPSSMFTAFVSSTDTVTIRAANISLIAIDPASGLFKVKVFKD
jgi:hypothetical protein